MALAPGQEPKEQSFVSHLTVHTHVARMLLVAPGLTTSNKKPLEAKDIATIGAKTLLATLMIHFFSDSQL